MVKSATSTISNVQKDTTTSVERIINNSVIKEVLANKESDRNYGLIQTLIAAGVPSIILGWLGWIYRRRFGGATEPPFLKRTATK